MLKMLINNFFPFVDLARTMTKNKGEVIANEVLQIIRVVAITVLIKFN